jgi:hypothetical protein
MSRVPLTLDGVGGWHAFRDFDGHLTFKRQSGPYTAFWRPGDLVGVCHDSRPNAFVWSVSIARSVIEADALANACVDRMHASGWLARKEKVCAGPAVVTTVKERARRYLATLPASVEGEAGASALFNAAVKAVRGFDLHDDDALELLRDYNARAVPPWPEHELKRAIANARRNGRLPFGALLEKGRSHVNA